MSFRLYVHSMEHEYLLLQNTCLGHETALTRKCWYIGMKQLQIGHRSFNLLEKAQKIERIAASQQHVGQDSDLWKI